MKNIWLWVIGLGAVAGAGYYYYTKKAPATKAAPAAAAAAVAGGSNNQTAFMNFLGTFGVKANAQTTNQVTSAFSNLQSVSALFGGPATGTGVPVGNVNTPTSSSGPATTVDTSGLDLSDDASSDFGGDDSDA